MTKDEALRRLEEEFGGPVVATQPCPSGYHAACISMFAGEGETLTVVAATPLGHRVSWTKMYRDAKQFVAESTLGAIAK
jgi:hypothetical protein